MMNHGELAIRAMMQEAERLRLTYSQFDASQIEEANDALERAEATVKGLTTQLTIQLAPVIKALADDFASWASDIERSNEDVRSAIRFTTEVVMTLGGVLKALGGIATIVGGIFVGTVAKIGWLFAQLQQGVAQIITLGGLLGDLDWGNDLEDQMMDLNDEAQRLKDAGADMFEDGWTGGPRERAMAALEEIWAEADKLRKTAEEVKDKGTDMANAVGDALATKMTPEMRAAAQAAKQLEAAIDSTMQQYDEYVDSITPGGRALRDELGAQYSLYAKLQDLGLWREAKYLREFVAEEKKRTAALSEREKIVQRLLDYDKQRRDLMQQQADALAAHTMSLKDQLAMEQAATRYDRERLRIQQELARNIAAAGSDAIAKALAHKLAQEKLDKVLKDETEEMRKQAEEQERNAKAAGEAADASEKAAAAAKEQAQAITKMADITQRFQRVGQSIFGFGAGQVGTGLANITGGAVRLPPKIAGRGGGKSPASSPAEKEVAKAVKAAAANVRDLSPAMREARNAIKQIEPLWKRLTEQVTALAKETKESVKRMGDATERAVSTVRSEVTDLRSKVRAFEERLARAASPGAGGR
jgi:hypothetical protein